MKTELLTNVTNDLSSGNTVQQDPFVSYMNQVNTYINTYLKKDNNKHSLSGFSFEKEVSAAITIVPDNKNLDKIRDINFSGTNVKFILNSVVENRTEKFQIFETFGDPAIFFFDKKVSMYTFSGFLIDSEHNKHAITSGINAEGGSWAIDFKNFWDDKFRGTQLINNGQIALITFNKSGIWGYPVNLNTNISSAAPFLSGFSFNMIVTNHKFNKKISGISALDSLSAENKEEFQDKVYRLQAAEQLIRDMEIQNANNEDIDTEKLSGYRTEAETLFSDIMRILRSASVNR